MTDQPNEPKASEGFFSEYADAYQPEKDSFKAAFRERDSYYAANPTNIDESIRWEELKIYRNDSDEERKLRREYAQKSYLFSYTWAGFIALLILLKGFGTIIGFELNQTEFLTVIGALSATILAYYTFVVRYLFARNGTMKNLKK